MFLTLLCAIANCPTARLSVDLAILIVVECSRKYLARDIGEVRLRCEDHNQIILKYRVLVLCSCCECGSLVWLY